MVAAVTAGTSSSFFNLLERMLKQLKVRYIQIEHNDDNELQVFVGLVINTSNLTISPRCPRLKFPCAQTQPTVLQATTCQSKRGMNVFLHHAAGCYILHFCQGHTEVVCSFYYEKFHYHEGTIVP